VATFGERLKAHREAAGLSQPQLAERSGVPVGTIRDYEQGRREPLLGAAAKLARALKKQLEDFLDDAGQAEAVPAKKTRKRKGEK
jgi:transcriptional regulator with XRE-family HTH domain